MRSRIRSIFPLAALALAACSGESVAQPPPAPIHWSSLHERSSADAGKEPKTTNLERAAVDTYLKSLVSPGCEQLATALDENAHFEVAGAKGVHGRARVVKAHDELFGAFDRREFTARRVWLTDSSQILEWTMGGVHARPWMKVGATNRSVSIRGLTLLWTKDDGSITDVHVYVDEAVVKAQLGAGPKGLDETLSAAPQAGAHEEIEAQGTPEEAANISHVRAALDAFEKGDEPAYLAAMKDDVEVTSLERAQPSRGKEDARAYLKTMHKAIAQLDVSLNNVWGAGPFVVAEYFIVGEQIGPLGWVRPQRDTVMRMSVVDIVEMRDGKIARVWRYDDPSQLLAP